MEEAAYMGASYRYFVNHIIEPYQADGPSSVASILFRNPGSKAQTAVAMLR